ncbi:MAG: hypothetical protein A2148_06975 [Chloroflexi bacterium RBG_16_68_14]|nr:MAG: hypothetical protein A2148_06975 [Chloroflexi bacterium RBG_16_68_14]
MDGSVSTLSVPRAFVRIGSFGGLWLAAGLLLAAVLLAACGGGSGERSVTGVIIDVQSTSLTRIDSFTLRDNDGRTLVFAIAPDAANDPQEGFFPGHLRTHALAAEQVTVSYREEDGELLALRVVDR